MKEIKLSNSDLVAIVDDDMYEELSSFNWYLNAGYAVWLNKLAGKWVTIRMHRLINQTPEGLDTDHINGNRLDNRKENLRSATHSQNLCNAGKRHRKGGTSSQYKGVSWNKREKKWLVSIGVNSKPKYQGLFTSEVAAARAYDEAAKKYHGDFAKLNFPDEPVHLELPLPPEAS